MQHIDVFFRKIAVFSCFGLIRANETGPISLAYWRLPCHISDVIAVRAVADVMRQDVADAMYDGVIYVGSVS